MKQDITQQAKLIKCLICDVDGVLTNGQIHMTADGQEIKSFYVHDGLGLKRLAQRNITIAIISSRRSPAVDARMAELGIEHVYQGQNDKGIAFQELLNTLKISAENVAYMGDDLADLSVMTQVGLSIAVANAVSAVKATAHYITEKKGGEGAVREISDLILRVQYPDE